MVIFIATVMPIFGSMLVLVAFPVAMLGYPEKSKLRNKVHLFISLCEDTVHCGMEVRGRELRWLLTWHPQSGMPERWMRMLDQLCPFYGLKDPSPGDGAAHLR